MTVPVVWVSLHEPDIIARDYADQSMLESLMAGECWRVPRLPAFSHHVGFESLPAGAQGAVVVIPARWHADDVEALSEALSRLSWSLIVLTGDEESCFSWERLDGVNRRVWLQTPRGDRHQGASALLGDGWWPGTREALAALGDRPRNLDWFYSGQVNNPQREACATALATRRNRLHDGVLRVTHGFASGLPQDEYLVEMVGAKVAPAPSGAYSQDSFRLFEALEAGCVPVADVGVEGRAWPGYWPFLFGEDPPFPVLEDWSQFDGICDRLLERWPADANRCGAWWLAQKRRLAHKLVSDLTELGVTLPEPAVDDQITVLIPVSPVPSHPDTAVLDETVQSVRDRLPSAEILVMVDGVRTEQRHRTPDYAEFTRRLVRRCQHEWRNVLPVPFDEHLHQAAMTTRTLTQVSSPLILFVEQDTPLVGEIPFDRLAAAVRSGEAHAVRLHHEAQVLQPHEHMMLDSVPVDVKGAPLLRTVQWSQRPHLADRDFYARMLSRYFGTGARSFIEDVVHGVLENGWRHNGMAAWEEFRLWMYAPTGDMKRSTHTDGRAGEEKYPQVWAYDGPTPRGAPNPRVATERKPRHGRFATVRFGIFGARADRRGLAAQTTEICRHLQPDRVFGIDMGELSPYANDWSGYDPETLTVARLDDIAEPESVVSWLEGLDVVVGCETFYREWFVRLCRERGVCTVLAPNAEFAWTQETWGWADEVIPPTDWHMEWMPSNAKVLPLGVDRQRFDFRLRTEAKSFLLVVGHAAAADRAGARVLFEALNWVHAPMTVIIRAQREIRAPRRYGPHIDLRIEIADLADNRLLYEGADVLVAPRRYGGQHLPMAEALSCGMPVLMADASPQNRLLPDPMLVRCTTHRHFEGQGGRVIMMHDADPRALGETMDRLAVCPTEVEALSRAADELAREWDWDRMAERWFDVIEQACR